MTSELIAASMVEGVFFLFAILIVVGLLIEATKPSKSKEYRRTLADMYVVGKIKQFAGEEKIDINAELKEFAKAMKVKRIDIQDLDNTIEESIQEKIGTEVVDKLEKDKPKA